MEKGKWFISPITMGRKDEGIQGFIRDYRPSLWHLLVPNALAHLHRGRRVKEGE